MTSSRILDITRLGAQGDGVSAEAGRAVYVAGALAGERVRASGDGERLTLEEVVAPSPARITPFCPNFGVCGGCAVQHLAEDEYRAWKRGLAAEALSRAGLDVLPGELVDGHGGGRRRVTLHARRRGGQVVAGFMRARSHDLVAIEACPILEPALQPAPRLARALAAALPEGKPLTILVTASEGGLDVDLRGQGPVSDRLRLSLSALAERLDLARLSLHGDVVVQRRPPVQLMAGVAVVPPPGGFLQPTRAGEEALVNLAMAALPDARRGLDLFAGAGPFTLALARRAEVHAVESEQKALVALTQAARGAQGLRRITTEARDLFRRPLLAPEYASFDAVLLDPPRAGAEAVATQLARTDVPAIAYVSCDPASFARDAAILSAGGHALVGVTPVDQFRYSHHVELVAAFRKEGGRTAGGRRGRR